MKLVKVIKNGQVVQPVRFDNDADMNTWLQMLADTAAWGLPERWLVDSGQSPLSEEQKATALETRTVEVMGQEVIEYLLPSEYIIETEDIMAELNYEKDIQKRINRINFGTRIFAELATRNVIRLKAGQTTIEQLLSAEEKLAKVQRLMGNSSTETALQTLIALDIPEIPSEEKALFVAKIQEYLQNGG